VDNFVLYLVCIILGGAGAWLISRWGKGLGLMDKPNERSSHKGFVPKGGGIGIVAAFIFASLFLKISFTFWLPAAFIALLSFWGDKFNLSPKIRLPLQFIAALVLVQLSAFSFQPYRFSSWLYS
jgi:Fuc2NAc and GlcNAc transferase